MVCLNTQDAETVIDPERIRAMTDAPVLELSARTGQGIPELMEELARRLSIGEESDGRLTARRHIELAGAAADRLEAAVEAIGAGMPLDTAAIDIREALDDLAEITGENATEAVIDRVFANFCVGK